MKVPVINSNPALFKTIIEIFEELNSLPWKRIADSQHIYETVAATDHENAIECILYEMPELVLINFSDENIDAFKVIQQMQEDPWMNTAGIIALYSDTAVNNQIKSLKNVNIFISIQINEIPRYLVKVLSIIKHNRQFIYHKIIHETFFNNVSGQFIIDIDLTLVPLYSNLIANYLFNLNFLEERERDWLRFGLSEMLINSIEHGNCEISGEEKREHIEKGLSMQELIDTKLQDSSITDRKVTFRYEISRTHSLFVITDEGKGFDWRNYLNKEMDESDPESLLSHGRGILLTNMNFEEVVYNDKGNQVRLKIKHLEKLTSATPAAFAFEDTLAFESGEIVFRQNEKSSSLYYILEGEFRVEVDRQTIALLTPSDMWIGEMSFLLDEMRSATVVANTKGKLIEISKTAFIQSIKKQPHYALFLARLLARRLERTSKQCYG